VVTRDKEYAAPPRVPVKSGVSDTNIPTTQSDENKQHLLSPLDSAKTQSLANMLKPATNNSATSTKQPDNHASNVSTLPDRVRDWFDRYSGLLDIPQALVFGIILYLVDVGSDIMAGINHFNKGNPVWSALTITFVVLPALCWAVISWTWWYCDPKVKRTTDAAERERRQHTRSTRMKLAVLLLDPLVT